MCAGYIVMYDNASMVDRQHVIKFYRHNLFSAILYLW
jgi:hypothetical protein